ncbi:MAG: transporter substrate-binding domain-containing protein [Burkholderiaceae bacterium]|jgi:glutamate/aspartate transport system substrate-binding protein|nr:transporter substrate-binding domain-containing protein [Oxalobacteraceae bacterium]
MSLHRLLALALILTGGSGLVLADTLEKITRSGRVTFGYRESSVPFSYLAGPRQPIGFGVDIYTHVIPALKRATGRNDLEVNWQALTSQNRIPLIANGTVDLECGSTSNTAARAKTVAFAINYFYTGPKLLVKKDAGIHGFDDLAGKRVAVTTGTTTMKLLRKLDLERGMNMQLLPGKDHVDSFLLVDAGRAVAFAMDDILLYGQILNAKQPGQWQVVGTPPQVEAYACMLRKDDPAFKRVVDDVIIDLMRSGEFEQIYAKWFLSPIPPRGRSLNLPMSEALRDNLRKHSDQPAN